MSPLDGATPVLRAVELVSGTGVVAEPESVELVAPATAGLLPKPSMAVPAATEGFGPCADGCAEPCASAAVDSVPSVAIIRYR